MHKLLGLALTIMLLTASSATAEQLSLLTGTQHGVYHTFGSVIAQVITNQSDGKLTITPQISEASEENIRVLSTNDADLAIIQSDVAHHAYHGTGIFKERYPHLRAIARLYHEYLHVCASKKSNVQTIIDFKGKKVSVGNKGSGIELNCRQIFHIFGIDYSKLKPRFLTLHETTEQFINNQLDCFIMTIGIPNKVMQDITNKKDVHFISLEGPGVATLIKKFPYLLHESIPANTYKGQDNPIPTLATEAILVASDKMSDDVAYKLTKVLFENLPAIKKLTPVATTISLKHAKDGITIPFHPGALKYLDKKGRK